MTKIDKPGKLRGLSDRRGRLFLLLLALAAALGMSPAAAEPSTKPEPPCLFQSDGRDLAKVKQRAAAGDKQLAAVLTKLRERADRELKTKPLTVVNKPKAPPSGDKHDYVSMAPYFWPDPKKKDGLPYIRRDGQVNPEREKYDAPLLKKMAQAVSTLALAYYLTGEERYARHAAELLRVWFLDAKTRMNPNLNYAQFIRGVNQGRGIGIIDTVALLQVVDAIGMLEGARSWTRADQTGMKKWFRDYLKWMRSSKGGKEEAAAANNHGSWYDVQVATYALFVGEARELVKRFLEASKAKRITRQIEPDGRQPLELKRTKPFDYSQVNLRALFALATLGDRVGVDLWHFETKDGRGIRKALDWLIPYATGEKKWQYKQITRLRGGSLAPLLRRAAVAYQEKRYEKMIEKLRGRTDLGTAGLLYPSPN
jgi:Alginate lyase